MDNTLPCKPGVTGSILCYSILAFGCSRHKILTQTINPSSPVLVTTNGKATFKKKKTTVRFLPLKDQKLDESTQ